MPNYYNPYNFYPVSYTNPYNTAATPQMNQSYAPMPQSNGPKMMEWVEGEVGAKAFQMPNGWPANSPIPLWDSTDTVIYLKSWSPMGIPNPMQKLKYEMPEQQNQQFLASGTSQASAPDMSQYVTKHDLEQLKNELRNSMIGNNQNGNGSGSNNGNRGGNR